MKTVSASKQKPRRVEVLTRARLLELLSYNKRTGLFKWVGTRLGTAVAPSPARDKRTSRSAVAFGRLNGTYESTPATSSATIPPRRAGHLHRKPA